MKLAITSTERHWMTREPTSPRTRNCRPVQSSTTYTTTPSQPAGVESNKMSQLTVAMTNLMQQNTALMATVTKSREPGN